MTERKSPFHVGELQAQARAGVAPPAGAGIRDFMPDQHRDFFAQLPFVLLGAIDDRGWPAASVLTGPPGFAASPDPRTLSIAAAPAPDDPLAHCLVAGRRVGLLGIDLATRRRNRANGCIVSTRRDRLTIAVEQSFGNCPQYIQGRDITGLTSPQCNPIQAFSHLDAVIRSRIAVADTFFVATSSGTRAGANAGVDVSHRGGKPGFIRVDGDTLTIPDFKGNRYFNTFGNLMLEPRASLLFLDFPRGDLLHLQGQAEIVWKSGVELGLPSGAERLWRLHVERGSLRRRALGLRWSFRELAPTTAATGVWQAA
jgi:predicted pyridoxine 5'-phosphate oxidase superfamily flavin-nucleotide-binding protein